jgi:hypothetical protein
MPYLRDIKLVECLELDQILSDQVKIQEIRTNIQNGDVYVVKRYFSAELCNEIMDYLKRVGQHSIPNYHPIKNGAPNFHRMNKTDPRAFVKGAFHQFSFFPWNQDYFDLFDKCKNAYSLKNLTSNLPKNKFLKIEPEEGCTARIAAQFYPKGYGFLNKHKDPVDTHQLTVPIMILSKKGEHFNEGGAFLCREDGSKENIDNLFEPGDVIYFSAEIPHGVEAIDPESNIPWLNFEGRWMLLLAVNKLSDNSLISNATDLG